MLDPVLGGSFISAGAGLLSNALNVGSVIQTNQAQKDLAKYQVDLERQLINEQNAYNSPAKQMARYQEAGLNPNLIYGNGSSSAGNQNSIARYNIPNVEAPSFDLSGLSNMLIAGLSLKKAKADADKAFFDAGYTQEMVNKLRMENRVFSALTGFEGPDVKYPGFSASPYFRKYSAELSAVELGNTLKQSSEQLNQLSAAERRYYIEHIQPLVMQGHSLQNSLLRKEVDTFFLRFGFDAGTRVLNSITNFSRLTRYFR